MADRWLAQTPDNFLFGFRRTQADQPFPTATVCETRKPGWASSDWRYARSRINRLGPVLFQLPRTFTIDPAVLEDFLRNWPRGLRVSFEFRHPSWFTDATYEILRHHRAGLCLAERDEMASPGVLTHHSFIYACANPITPSARCANCVGGSNDIHKAATCSRSSAKTMWKGLYAHESCSESWNGQELHKNATLAC